MSNQILVICFLFISTYIVLRFVQYNSSASVQDFYKDLSSTRTEQILVKHKIKEINGNLNKEQSSFTKTLEENVKTLTNVVHQLLEKVSFGKNDSSLQNKVEGQEIKKIEKKEIDFQSCQQGFLKWYNNSIGKEANIENDDELETYLNVHCSKDQELLDCQSNSFVGPLAVHEKNFTWLSKQQIAQVGGWWSPTNCKPKQHTVIIIPYRQREYHLSVLIHHLHPLLQKQNLHYRILVVQQNDNQTFNRAKLMNVGYKEAMRYFPYRCFVFHDVDLVPEDDRIDYSCPLSPMHMSVAVSTLRYQLPYGDIFGGVSALLQEDFEKVNGFPNTFWEWGGEDDNLSYRLKYHGLKIHRQSVQIARYKMLSHSSRRSKEKAKHLYKFLDTSFQFIGKDGLNSLQYSVVERRDFPLYTLLEVDLQKEKDQVYNDIEAVVATKLAA